MIEVLFGESEASSMKVAKNYKKPEYNDSAIAWFGDKPSKGEFGKMFERKAIGGISSEVICLPFMLDIGDIDVSIVGEYRRKLILDMYTINGIDDDIIQKLKDSWDKHLNEIERLKNYAVKGETIRIWYSDAPYSMCGFYYVCSILRKYNCEIYVVKLPKYIQLSDNTMQYFTSWNEIDPGKFSRFLPLEKRLSPLELQSFSSNWNELKDEKNPLRAIVNGKLIGVSEDFYDYIIRKEIPEDEFIMARLIGKIMGKYSLGVSDSWYAKRIEKMIEEGELKVVKKKKEIYRQTLKKG